MSSAFDKDVQIVQAVHAHLIIVLLESKTIEGLRVILSHFVTSQGISFYISTDAL